MTTYSAKDVKLFICGEEVKGFDDGAHIEITSDSESPYPYISDGIDVYLTFGDPGSSYRKWTELLSNIGVQDD